MNGLRLLILTVACASGLATLPASARTRLQGAAPSDPGRAAVSRSAASSKGAGLGGQRASRPAGQPALPVFPLEPSTVLVHIRKTIDWYRQAQSVESLPQAAQDLVARDRLQQAALAAVRLAFTFGRAAATLLASAPQAAASGVRGAHPAASLDQAAARVDDRIAALQQQLARIDAALVRAPARSRAPLRAQQESLDAALRLEREVQSTLAVLRRFQASTLTIQARGTRDLRGQIEDLERSVPEARQAAAAADSGVSAAVSPVSAARDVAAAASARAAPAAASAGFRLESAGIVTLIGEWFGLQSDGRRLADLAEATDALTSSLEAIRTPLLDQARSLVRTSVVGLGSASPAELESARRSLEDAATRFRQVATLLVPLGEQDFVLDDARRALTEWRDSLHARLATITRYLLMRAVLLAALIGLVLVVSEVWRRAVFRYLHDARRRSQFQSLRRVAVSIALVLVLVFGLMSHVGSLATYVGFLTAGLAVALQNVILAIVAYFFLIGRYGVRVGDRITLAGVTGRVADIGLVRIYLMELAGPDLRPTGRVVVMSNAVLFQPQALFKQIPGADYVWHSISMTLAHTVDVQGAEQRLKAAADAVYEQYRASLEAQHAAVQRLVEFETSMPWPEVRVRFAEIGMRFEIRYPVQGDQAAAIDRKMLQRVRDALAQEPQLALAASGEPALDPSDK